MTETKYMVHLYDEPAGWFVYTKSSHVVAYSMKSGRTMYFETERGASQWIRNEWRSAEKLIVTIKK